MKYIEKANPLQQYESWKQNYTTENRKSPLYKNIPQGLKKSLKEHLVAEQKGLCCYCCCRVSGTTEDSHIEHFYPQSLCTINHRKKQVAYENMFISCNGYIEGISDDEKESCGHRKNNWYVEEMISPNNIQCESIFKYLLNGTIKPADESNGVTKQMIINLGLDTYSLNTARKAALEAIGYYDDDFNEEEMMLEIERVDEKGFLIPFYDMLKQIVCD